MAGSDGLYGPSLPLNILKVFTPLAGQRIIPSRVPAVAPKAGPSEAAPHSTGTPPDVPSNAPARLATWCWMQLGKVVEPSPTMKDDPQGLAPRILASHLREYVSYCGEPVI